MSGKLRKENSMSFRKSVDHLEMDDKAKRFRKALMDLSPNVSVSKNDLFNLGYGSLITLLVCVGFCVTFFYYAIANSIYNKTAKFLVPANGGEIKGAMRCSHVSIALSDSYAVDSEGRWNSDTDFRVGDSLYGLEMVNAQYKSDDAYTTQMKAFSDDMSSKSAASEDNDYAWNLVFGGSYAVVEDAGEGKAYLFVDADSRLMYDVPLFTEGTISSINGSCVPEYSSLTYDGQNFNFELSVPKDGHLCPNLTKDGLLEDAMGLDISNVNGNSDWAFSSIKIDAASVTTAIAINYGIASLESLDEVPTLDQYYFLTAYVDSGYTPMQPVYCFDPQELGSDDSLTDLCLLKIGNTFAFPITAHYGDYRSYTGEDPFIPDACDCETIDEHEWCHTYDIDVGLLFIPSDYYTDILIAMLYAQLYAEGSPFQTFVRPLLAAGVETSYYLSPGELFYDYDGLNSLKTHFRDVCPECFLLAFELYDGAHENTGPTINKGGRVIPDMACTNVFYNADVLDEMSYSPPSKITEPYLVCTDSMTTAVSTGISNAYASAGLYTSVFIIILMFFVHRFHEYRNEEELYSSEEKEVRVRNAIADLFEYVLNNQNLPDEDQDYLREKLQIIGITDPLTHAERPNNLGHIAALLAASKAGPAPGARPETIYHGRLVDQDEPEAETGAEMTATGSRSPTEV